MCFVFCGIEDKWSRNKPHKDYGSKLLMIIVRNCMRGDNEMIQRMRDVTEDVHMVFYFILFDFIAIALYIYETEE